VIAQTRVAGGIFAAEVFDDQNDVVARSVLSTLRKLPG